LADWAFSSLPTTHPERDLRAPFTTLARIIREAVEK
jgi:hypothetical protein